ncbi:TetR/AcrR family transcriptional regulator [Catenulispora pinisilvae]|uniref:TetR/AcrR family transcriptional regulator n=1 Tax=Catenulispora pinisilvae TaxID=2705253 RepID=UPI001891E31A|nr:TetR/AcrR family transcriptional regulator [Catenulispora pinisilvae]
MARAGLSPELVVTAAAELADEIGFENLTIGMVARRFGVKEPSLYSHIRNANDLRVRVAARALGELADRVAEALAGRAGREALLAFAAAYRDYAKSHPGRFAAARMPFPLDSPAADAARRNSDLNRALLRGYALGEPAETDAVRLLGATILGFVTLEAGGSYQHNPRPADDSWNAAIEALDVALRNWPAA